MKDIYNEIFGGWLADAEYDFAFGNENATFPPTYEEWAASLTPEEVRKLQEEWA